MEGIFSVICKKCNGKCCKSTVFLTQSDIDRWEQFKGRFEVSKKEAGFMLAHESECPFLDEETGCTLGDDLKPFDCILFPLAFTYEKGKIRFYLNKKALI